jgi:alkyl hydroperoxide reductase subunit AhpF
MSVPGGGDDLEWRLSHLEHSVRLVFFTQTFGCDTCLPARQAIDQIADLSERITVEEHNLVLDKEKVEEYGVERVPAIAIVGESDLGIRYYGVPAGYELASIVDAVLLAGTGEIGLSDKSLAAIAGLERSVDIKVFVTPT